MLCRSFFYYYEVLRLQVLKKRSSSAVYVRLLLSQVTYSSVYRADDFLQICLVFLEKPVTAFAYFLCSAFNTI